MRRFVLWCALAVAQALYVPRCRSSRRRLRPLRSRSASADSEESAESLLAAAAALRAEAADLEATLPKREAEEDEEVDAEEEDSAPSVAGKTVVVCGANGLAGSAVCARLLEAGATVRAVVRSTDLASYERLSYAVGAESLVGTIEAPWILRDTSEGGPLFDSPARYSAPDDASLADVGDDEYAAMTPSAQNRVVAARAAKRLKNLEVRPADVRTPSDARSLCAGADAVVYCASSFKGASGAPAAGDDRGRSLLEETSRLFELRLPRLGRVTAPPAAPNGETADVEGVSLVGAALDLALRREGERPGRPTAFVLLSAVDAFGGDFGDRKRSSEDALRRCQEASTWSGSVALRLPALDEFAPEAGCGYDVVGAAADRRGKVNPRDLARAVLLALEDPAFTGPDFAVADVARDAE